MFILAVAIFVGALGAFLLVRQRQVDCAFLPLLGDELLPNAALVPAVGTNMPAGWESDWPGVELRGKAFSNDPKQWGFDLDGDGRALQLIGIANEVLTPPISVRAGQGYCFVGQALTDSPDKQSAIRLRTVFDWRDASGKPLAEDESPWQPVALWHAGAQGWSPIHAAFRAPAGASGLRVRLQPSSDDRVYLDGMHVRQSLFAASSAIADPEANLAISPWPSGAKAAISFSFDWETAMGGLIHTKSLQADDPNFKDEPLIRAMRMRDGVTTTLDLFRPYNLHATYFATGYNFLNGNTEKRMFLDNPTYDWAQAKNRWDNRWKTTPWFADDPFGTVKSDPGWYFGDLVPTLVAAQQDIQSHTFAHFSGQFVKVVDWRKDFAAWKTVAAAQHIAPARVLAFPWSSSNGMSDDDWNTLAGEGITAVTRLFWSQPKSALFPKDAQGVPLDSRCRPIPGHETILGCPDFYLRDGSAITATQAIDRAIAASGMIDLWAHTEEVTMPSQIATWRTAVQYAAAKREAGAVWIAPFAEIASRQQAIAHVTMHANRRSSDARAGTPLRFVVANRSGRVLDAVTVHLPFAVARADAGTQLLPENMLVLPTLPADGTLEVNVWPS